MKKYYPYALCLSLLLAGNAGAWTLKNTSSQNFVGTNGLSVSVPAQGTSADIKSPTALTPSTVYGNLGTTSCKYEGTSAAFSSNQQIPIQLAARTSKTATTCSLAQPRICCHPVITPPTSPGGV